MSHDYLSATPLLDYRAAPIQALVAQRGWAELTEKARIGAAYEFVRNEVLFGYNSDDALPASKVLADGYGQCNTKGTLLMALLRALKIPCRFHGFTIDKRLQRGVVPEAVYPLAPRNIIHSWVEVQHGGTWLELEGFILDRGVLEALQASFPKRRVLCAYGVGTDCLQTPSVGWAGQSTYIQKTGINSDLGVFDSPDAFYADHRQLTGLRGLAYRLAIRHWMNRRVAQIRAGRVPAIPGGESNLLPPVPIPQDKGAAS
ncbi:transglutaminase family protein [Aliishimia ponticola]|uniref:Transglutaminase family protein n=1 Tax=Aliishimia ponticola TaxID=2499833 RepID=A0A4S4N850_9RHOB|nr:transglutaminase family protein [Aliishimia ponticola]THH35374.1 transglutaminase family protein [Aliishimia ponticola]